MLNKTLLTLVYMALITVACSNERKHKRTNNSIAPTETGVNSAPNSPVTPEVKPNNPTIPATDVFTAETIFDQNVVECTPRGNLQLCRSGAPVVLQSLTLGDYLELVGEEVEVEVSFQGNLKAEEIFSIEADGLPKSKTTIPDGTNPSVKLVLIAPKVFDLKLSSILENNPQLMFKDFKVDLNDMNVKVGPSAYLLKQWATDGEVQIEFMNSKKAELVEVGKQNAIKIIAKIEKYNVQDSAAMTTIYSNLKAQVAAL